MNIRKIFYVLLFLIVSTGCQSQSDQPKYAVAILNTPVLNTADFESVFGGSNGTSVKLDKSGLIREMEFIAFPNTVFEILEVIPKRDHNIYKITTDDYPYNSSDLFIDSRFVNTSDTLPEQRELILPDKKEILAKLNSLDGYGYMWGGNYGDGIEQLLEFYQPASEPDVYIKDLWSLKGVDCSGLIYQATNGSTPRNTSTLINYGEGIDIAGKSASEISSMLQPLDLIVWSGHVIIVYDENTVIESTGDAGVHKSDLTSRLKSIMREKTPVNDWNSTSGKRFVVRRWYF
ncbi:MAG TPA: peptidoglycan endopeptidase [Ignavibacteria bacterium]|nr:peptidoglycan endopeptidase [Ignavibacteria bacterium]